METSKATAYDVHNDIIPDKTQQKGKTCSSNSMTDNYGKKQ